MQMGNQPVALVSLGVGQKHRLLDSPTNLLILCSNQSQVMHMCTIAGGWDKDPDSHTPARRLCVYMTHTHRHALSTKK